MVPRGVLSGSRIPISTAMDLQTAGVTMTRQHSGRPRTSTSPCPLSASHTLRRVANYESVESLSDSDSGSDPQALSRAFPTQRLDIRTSLALPPQRVIPPRVSSCSFSSCMCRREDSNLGVSRNCCSRVPRTGYPREFALDLDSAPKMLHEMG
jgi:hypothetical protein